MKENFKSQLKRIEIIYLILIIVLFSLTESFAQLKPMNTKSNVRGIELTGMYGYQFGGGLDSYDGKLTIQDSDNMMFSIDVPIRYGMMVELSYTRQSTSLKLKERGTNITSKLTDLALEYYQIGAIKGLPQGKVVPFGQFSLGATRFHPTGSKYSDTWTFSVTLGLGAKIHINDRFGLRLQANMLIPMRFSGVGFWFGTGGASAGMTADGFLQGNVMGGLFIKI